MDLPAGRIKYRGIDMLCCVVDTESQLKLWVRMMEPSEERLIKNHLQHHETARWSLGFTGVYTLFGPVVFCLECGLIKVALKGAGIG